LKCPETKPNVVTPPMVMISVTFKLATHFPKDGDGSITLNGGGVPDMFREPLVCFVLLKKKRKKKS